MIAEISHVSAGGYLANRPTLVKIFTRTDETMAVEAPWVEEGIAVPRKRERKLRDLGTHVGENQVASRSRLPRLAKAQEQLLATV